MKTKAVATIAGTSDPTAYARRVLVCVSGLSPQIVTETLYALAVDPQGPRWVPTEIHVITTADGAQQARLALLAPDRDQFGRLCRDFGLTEIHFDENSFTVIRDRDDRALEDIRTPEHNEAAADTIVRVIAGYAADPTCAIHASLAGGRKTMGFFLGYAISLFGRPQDRLSHVLVSEGFESHPQFFYPPPKPVTLQDRSGREMSTADARVVLAQIPFITLRNGMPTALQNGRAGYSETVRAYRPPSASDAPEIDRTKASIRWRDQSIKLTPTELAVYVWLAERAIRPNGKCVIEGLLTDVDALVREFTDAIRLHFSDGSHAIDVSERFAEIVATAADFEEWIRPHRTRINQRIRSVFGRAGFELIGIQVSGKRKRRSIAIGAAGSMIRFI